MRKAMWYITHTIAAILCFVIGIPVMSMFIGGWKSNYESWKEFAFSMDKPFGGLDELFVLKN